jgi:cysteine desulfurase
MKTCVYLEEKGYRVTYLPVGRDGRINTKDLHKALEPDTILVTIGHTNSEIGAVQPIEAIGEILSSYQDIYFHTDYVQGAAKIPLNIEKAGLDFVTVSAHKFHGLKGTGVLYKRPGTILEPLIHGGGQESGVRSGTENTAGAAAMAKAFRLAKESYAANSSRIEEIKDWTALRLQESGGVINSPFSGGSPFILNVSFPGIKPEVLVEALAERGASISTKTACASKNSEPSVVILAATGERKLAESAVRISFSADTKKEEAAHLCSMCEEVLPQLKKVMEEQQ